jgi:hypothetical protein
MREDFDVRWHELAEEVISGMKEWRLQHPKATLREAVAGCGVGECGGGHPDHSGRRAPGLSAVRGGTGRAGAPGAATDNASRPDCTVRAELRGLSGLRGRLFSPWMTNWPCYRGR